MRIIKEGNKNLEKEMTCRCCETVFAFEESDVKKRTNMEGDVIDQYVGCPVCGEKIYLRDDEVPHRRIHGKLRMVVV